jgi:ABC-type dipeptide/oligopeptide/nickel transport system permease component
VLIILANLAVDILHRALDPRLRDADAAYARA